MKKTTKSISKEAVKREWFVVDAEGKPLGRVAADVAAVLRGKHKTIFTPHVDCGDFVVVVNAAKVMFTGNKLRAKLYHHHSGFPGGLKTETLGHLFARRPADVFEKAVKGMLPKNILGRQMFRKLKVYTGPDHPHTAQQPKPLEVAAR